MDFDFAFVWSPLELSLRVAGAATAVSFVVATLAAWRLARKRGPMPALLDALCSLPLVLPPTVLGYYLILLVGRRGVFGPGLAELGINLIFSWQGAVVAATVVVFPLIYKSARASLEQVDKHLEDAARTLGASEWRVFVSVSLPLAWKGGVGKRQSRLKLATTTTTTKLPALERGRSVVSRREGFRCRVIAIQVVVVDEEGRRKRRKLQRHRRRN